MESPPSQFQTLHHDLIIDIMSRLDGCSLLATASTCTNLRDAAKDERLWEKLCHETWPSTMKTRGLPSKTIGFKNLYIDAFPLILTSGRDAKQVATSTKFETPSSPWDLVSLVDIYYRGHCIFSKVTDGMAGAHSDSFHEFWSYPFVVDLLCATSDNITELPLAALEAYQESGDFCNNIRLSWILLDKRNGRAVNISSWKSRLIYTSNPSDKYHTICFGCIVPVEDCRITQISSEFVITVRCKLMTEQGCIRWKEMTFVVEDIDGSHLFMEESMRVMNRALACSRSINHSKVDMGYDRFHKQKRELKLRNEQEETVANILSSTITIIVLFGIGYTCASLL